MKAFWTSTSFGGTQCQAAQDKYWGAEGRGRKKMGVWWVRQRDRVGGGNKTTQNWIGFSRVLSS